MIKNGVENEYIMKYTHLNKEKIEKLRRQMRKNRLCQVKCVIFFRILIFL